MRENKVLNRIYGAWERIPDGWKILGTGFVAGGLVCSIIVGAGIFVYNFPSRYTPAKRMASIAGWEVIGQAKYDNAPAGLYEIVSALSEDSRFSEEERKLLRDKKIKADVSGLVDIVFHDDIANMIRLEVISTEPGKGWLYTINLFNREDNSHPGSPDAVRLALPGGKVLGNWYDFDLIKGEFSKSLDRAVLDALYASLRLNLTPVK